MSLETLKTLYSYIKWLFASGLNKMISLRFEDFEFYNNQVITNYNSNIKSQRKLFTIPDDLFSKAIKFKGYKKR